MSSQEAIDPLKSLVGAGERKQLSILYYDLVESVALSDRIGDPESYLEIQSSIHTQFGVLLAGLGGCQYDVEGDGAWYLFGLLPPIEGDPTAGAARAAFAIMQEAEQLKLPLPAGWDLQFRVIIASGLVVVVPNEHRLRAAGNAMHLAARLKPVCPRGKIIIDRATRDRLGRSFHFAALEPQLLEGIKGKVEAFVLVAPQSGLTKFAAHDAARSHPLVGRQPELAKLSKQWQLAREGQGQGQASFIVGNAGIGKSRLALALVRRSLSRRLGTKASRQRNVEKVLGAAAWTYVAAAVTATLMLKAISVQCRPPNHVCGTSPAREGNNQVRFALIEHLLIPNWPGSTAVRVPVRWKTRDLYSISLSPFDAKHVGSTSASRDGHCHAP